MSDEREEYVQGPPPGYVPTPADDLRDPEFRRRQQLRGAELAREALAMNGIRKIDGEWVRGEPEEVTPS